MTGTIVSVVTAEAILVDGSTTAVNFAGFEATSIDGQLRDGDECHALVTERFDYPAGASAVDE